MYHVSAQSVDERMINVHYYYYVGEWGWGSRLEAWMKSHKSEVAIT